MLTDAWTDIYVVAESDYYDAGSQSSRKKDADHQWLIRHKTLPENSGREAWYYTEPLNTGWYVVWCPKQCKRTKF